MTISHDNVGEGLTLNLTTKNGIYSYQERTRKYVAVRFQDLGFLGEVRKEYS